MQDSKIEWTDHTFNPWWGCMKVSDGCKNCYAETLDKRWNGGHWGPGSTRKPMSESYWQQPTKWNEAARKAGVHAKVFCASMADVFEDRSDLDDHRTRLFNMIDQTPNLTWLLLTKRPENIIPSTPVWSKLGWPKNVWIGTSVENQKAADERVPHLLKVPAAVRFLSCEPLLGLIKFRWTPYHHQATGETYREYLHRKGDEGINEYESLRQIHWVIAGGESGHHARPMHPDWARSLRDQCAAAGVPYFFKQNGEYVSVSEVAGQGSHYKFPDGTTGKRLAGRTLDGKEHNEYPVTRKIPD